MANLEGERKGGNEGCNGQSVDGVEGRMVVVEQQIIATPQGV